MLIIISSHGMNRYLILSHVVFYSKNVFGGIKKIELEIRTKLTVK